MSARGDPLFTWKRGRLTVTYVRRMHASAASHQTSHELLTFIGVLGAQRKASLNPRMFLSAPFTRSLTGACVSVFSERSVHSGRSLLHHA